MNSKEASLAPVKLLALLGWFVSAFFMRPPFYRWLSGINQAVVRLAGPIVGPIAGVFTGAALLFALVLFWVAVFMAIASLPNQVNVGKSGSAATVLVIVIITTFGIPALRHYLEANLEWSVYGTGSLALVLILMAFAAILRLARE